jgi:hypothetical protein
VPATRRDKAGLRLAGRRAARQPGEGPGSGLPSRELVGIRRAETIEFCFRPELRPGFFEVSGILGVLGFMALLASGSLCC